MDMSLVVVSCWSQILGTMRKLWDRIEGAIIVIILAPFALVAWLLMLWPGKGALR